MDTRAMRTGYTGTTFGAGHGPSVDDVPWCTSYADAEHDADEFNPYRTRNKGVKSTGIASDAGLHTYIPTGRPDGGVPARAVPPGMRPDSGNVPEKSGVNMRDEYASYWVVFDT